MTLSKRSVALAITLVGAATCLLTTAAFADTLTVKFTGVTGYDPSTSTLTGTQVSTTSEKPTTPYAGTFALRGAPLGNGCYSKPTAALSFPSAGGKPASVTLSFGAKVCLTGGGPYPFTVVPNSGSGIFAGASGGGAAAFDSSHELVFTDTTGNLDPPPPPGPGATPELDSLVLFGVGASGLAGYALLRVRASRRRRSG